MPIPRPSSLDEPNQAGTPDDVQIPKPQWGWIPVALAVGIGITILLISMFEEPYHIDELRQTRAYGQPVTDIIDASFAQQQPPLDPLLNAAVQRLIGVGDPQQRALSVAFGIGTLIVFGALMMRTRLRKGAAASVLVLAMAPLLVSVTAYARPYALPLFLILLFLLATDVWLTDGRKWAGAALTAAAILLPLSKTVEPVLALILSIVILLGWKIRADTDWSGSVWLPIGAAATGTIAVGLPIIIRLQSELAGYTISGVADVAGLTRWFTEIPRALDESFSPWPIALLVAALAIAIPASRKFLINTWWFWILFLIPIAFATVFVVRTPDTQPFYSRYTFTWWPPFAVMVGAIVTAALDKHTVRWRTWQIASIGVVSLFFVGTAYSLQADLRTNVRYDFAALGAAVMEKTTPETTVIFDPAVPLGSYRTSFAGRWGRYLDSDRDVPLTTWIVRKPSRIPDSGPIAVALIDYQRNTPDWPIEVPLWQRVDVGPYESLYLPPPGLDGRLGAQAALLAFARVLGPDRGATFTLAAASLAVLAGDQDEACNILADLRTQIDSQLYGRIDRELVKAGAGGAWAETCSDT